MKHPKDFFERGTILPALFAPVLVATALFGLFTIYGMLAVPNGGDQFVDMRIEPQTTTVGPGESFIAQVVITSPFPVNVFSGELDFNPAVLEVESIDYNTSIADLWVEKPWYENGAGTLNFGGGTTRSGGFVGTGDLITIHFKARAIGAGTLVIKNARVLQHDGLGTDAHIREPLDALFTVQSATTTRENLLTRETSGTSYAVVRPAPTTDLNGDGKQSIADTSIFMLHMVGSDLRYDFNQDGKVNAKDLSIILNAP